MLRPGAPRFEIALAERWNVAGRRMRVALLVLAWIVVFVVALIASDFESPVYFAVVATPLLLMWRPWLGCLLGFGAGALTAVAPEPMIVRLLFGLHAVQCLHVLVRLLLQARSQRKVFAEVARVVTVDLPDDLTSTTAKRTRPYVVSALVVVGAVVGIALADVVWWVVVGSFTAIHAAREVAVRVLPSRLLTRPRHAVSMLVRAEPGGNALLLTEKELCAVASFRATAVLHRPDVDDPLLSLGQDLDEEPRTLPCPATVVGDFRVGGWVAVITDNCVLLPSGPLRNAWAPPAVTIAPTLVDGRRWSGIQPR